MQLIEPPIFQGGRLQQRKENVEETKSDTFGLEF